MKYDELLDIVKTGEGYTIELKRTLSNSIAKDICAFSNSSGGRIIIGVDDITNKVMGFELKNSDRSKIQNIARNMNPIFNVHIEQIRDLVVIYVPEGKDKPYTVNGHFYLRYGANSQLLNRDEIRDLFQKENIISFEKKTTDFNTEDWSETAFNHFRKETELDKDLSKEHLLKNLNFITNDKLNNCGVLLFSKDIRPYFPNATVSCFLYGDIEHTDILDSKEFHSDLISNLDDSFNYLLSKLNTAIIIDGLKHTKKLELPKEALREALINAMSHRDYFFSSNVQVQIGPDRVEIVNPGRLLFPREDLGKRMAQRNPLLMDMVHRLNLVEKAGSGIKRMWKYMKEYNLDIEFETGEFFCVIFHRNTMGIANAEQMQSKSEENAKQMRKKQKEERQNLILEELEIKGKITAQDLENKFFIHRGTVIRDLNELMRQNKIIKKGGGRNVWYELK